MAQGVEDVRRALKAHYGLDNSIPISIQEKIVEKREARMVSTRQLDRQKSVISQIFKDDRISFQQREQIALALLNGDVQVQKKETPHITMNDIGHFETNIHLDRHKFQNRNFLEMVSTAAPIQIASAKDLCEMTKAMKKASEPQQFNLPLQSEHSNSYFNDSIVTSSVEGDEGKGRSLHSLAKAANKSKQDYLNRMREEERRLKEEVVELKNRRREETERKKEFKRRIVDFRKRLNDRLRETNDPLTGPIMRCVDDGMAFYFMEKYQGFAMPVDSVIRLIGQTLGSDGLPPASLSPEELFESFEDPLESCGFGVRTRTSGPPQQQQQQLRASASATGVPGGGLGLVLKGMKKPAQMDYSYEAEKRREQIAADAKAYGRGLPWNAGQGLSTSPVKIGSGFRALPKLQGTDSILPPIQGHTQQQQQQQQQQQVAMADAVTRNAKRAFRPNVEKGAKSSPDFVAYFSDEDEDEGADGGGYHVAVNVVREQLETEGRLPSAQAEKVLTDQQLSDLAAKRASFDDVASAMEDERRRSSVRLSASAPALHPGGALSPPPSHKGGHGGLTPLDTSAPHASRKDEEGQGEEGRRAKSLVRFDQDGPGDAVSPLGSDADHTMSKSPTYQTLSAASAKATGGTGAGGPRIPRVVSAAEIRAPRALKTRSFAVDTPPSPYKNIRQALDVALAGVPAGSGHPLWGGNGPSEKTTKDGRWKVSGGSLASLHSRARRREEVRKAPFVSMT